MTCVCIQIYILHTVRQTYKHAVHIHMYNFCVRVYRNELSVVVYTQSDEEKKNQNTHRRTAAREKFIIFLLRIAFLIHFSWNISMV